MRAIRFLGLAAVLMVAPGLPTQAQPSFPMVCVPGPGMSMIVSPLGSDRTRIELRFRKAAWAWSFTRRPRPGECAWTDRPINPAEPSLMAKEVRARIWVEFAATGSGVAGAGVVGGVGSASARESAEFFLRVMRTSPCFVATVFNTGRGYFSIVALEDGC